MNFFIKPLALLPIILLLSACAFPPMTENFIDINPTINFQKSNIGHGKLISVYVIDLRDSQFLGAPLVPYSAHVIACKKSIKMILQHKFETMLHAWNFKIVPDMRSRFLEVTLLGLDDEARTITQKREATAIIKITLVNEGKRYEKTYFTSVPSASTYDPEQLAKDLNQCLNKILKNISNDQKLIKNLSN